MIFLGDYIDRGPKIREVLHLACAMMDAGKALAIMGNHELNAIFYHTPNGRGGHLRSHRGRHAESHEATLNAFAGLDEEWTDWLDWMKRLPIFLDLGELRAVHAAWDENYITFLRDKTLADDEFLIRAVTAGTLESEALERVLKGSEITLPDGVKFFDKEGTERSNVRVRWWNIAKGMTVGELAMPEPLNIPEPLSEDDFASLPNYPADAPPVFAGHYWLPPLAPKKPMADNVVILDFGAGLGNARLYGYRWIGEIKPHAHDKRFLVQAYGRVVEYPVTQVTVGFDELDLVQA